MGNRADRRYGLAGIFAVLLLIALVAIPVLAADPSATPPGPAVAPPASDPTATPSPVPESTKAPKPTKAPRPPKAPATAREPETTVTITGTVGTRTDADGRTEYTLTTGAVVRRLDAGPPWYWGDQHPLAPYVGRKVTVVGTSRSGTDEVDVTSVDGTQVREPGRPPWAGGWKAVGKDHPGWSQDKWDRWQARVKARGVDCWPPGHCKDKTQASDDPADD